MPKIDTIAILFVIAMGLVSLFGIVAVVLEAVHHEELYEILMKAIVIIVGVGGLASLYIAFRKKN